MKRMMTICAIALATTFSTWAQSDMQDPNRNQGEKRQNRSERPRAALDLDEKQKIGRASCRERVSSPV